MKSRKCDVFNIDVHRASYAKHLKSKKHIEKVKKNGMIITERFFWETIENKNTYNPKSLKQLAWEKIKLYHKELAKRMNNPYYFTVRALRVGFNITVESHNNNHANSKRI